MSRIRIILVAIIFGITLVPQTIVSAITDDQKKIFDRRVLYFNTEVGQCFGGGASASSGSAPASGGSASINGAPQLTERGKNIINSIGVDERVQKRKALFDHAEKQTGVPWYVVATFNYRENDLTDGRSVTNGQPLAPPGTGSYINVDGLMIFDDPKDDIVYATKHFISMAKSVYNVDVKTASSLEDWGKAFLAYNRGNLYKVNGKTFVDSPYVMNEFNENYTNMNWVGGAADPGSSTVGGGKEGRVGALPIMLYLSQKTFSGGAQCAGASGMGLVGGKAFPLKTTKAEMNRENPGLFKNGTTGQGGHPYTAYDILVGPGTEVIAMMDGVVTRISEDRCPGRLVGIYNKESNIIISYLHNNMDPSTHVKLGDTITAGQRVAQVGPPSAGCGIPHLHIDAAKGDRRPGCSRLNCPRSNASQFIDIGADLFKTYEALP